MKLSGQVIQYWTNLENRRTARDQSSIDTWDMMKEELETKYVPLSFITRLMNNDINTLKATNLQRSMLRNSMNSLSDAISSIIKVKFKFFLDLEYALDMNYERNY